MARLSAPVMEQRRAFIINFFNTNPQLVEVESAVDAAQKAIKAATTMMMNPGMIRDLFDKARGGAKAEAPKFQALPAPVKQPAKPAAAGPTPAPEAPAVDQNLVKALRSKVAELEAYTTSLREDNKALCLVIHGLRTGIKYDSKMTLIDIPAGLTKAQEDAIYESFKEKV